MLGAKLFSLQQQNSIDSSDHRMIEDDTSQMLQTSSCVNTTASSCTTQNLPVNPMDSCDSVNKISSGSNSAEKKLLTMEQNKIKTVIIAQRSTVEEQKEVSLLAAVTHDNDHDNDDDDVGSSKTIDCNNNGRNSSSSTGSNSNSSSSSNCCSGSSSSSGGDRDSSDNSIAHYTTNNHNYTPHSENEKVNENKNGNENDNENENIYLSSNKIENNSIHRYLIIANVSKKPNMKTLIYSAAAHGFGVIIVGLPNLDITDLHLADEVVDVNNIDLNGIVNRDNWRNNNNSNNNNNNSNGNSNGNGNNDSGQNNRDNYDDDKNDDNNNINEDNDSSNNSNNNENISTSIIESGAIEENKIKPKSVLKILRFETLTELKNFLIEKNTILQGIEIMNEGEEIFFFKFDIPLL